MFKLVFIILILNLLSFSAKAMPACKGSPINAETKDNNYNIENWNDCKGTVILFYNE